MDKKKGKVAISTQQWGHMMGPKFMSSWGVYYCIALIRLWTHCDDGLIIVDKSTPKKCDGIRKRLHRLFGEFGFKLVTQTDLKISDYLDVTLNLYNGTVSPFRKRNQDLRYVDRRSNHPIQVFKHIPKGIEHRLSNNSSNKEIFE